MSIFDPQQLFVHHQRKTHKGQVFQKRPTNLQFAASQEDFQKAVQTIQTYGYQITRALGFAYAFYSGEVSTTYFDYKSIFNSTIRQKLLNINPNIFANTFNMARVIINIQDVFFGGQGMNTFTIQVLNSQYSNNANGSVIVLPYSSTQLFINTGNSSYIMTRPVSETWNNGIYVENILDPNYYLSFVYDDYTNIPSTNLAIVSANIVPNTHWTFSVTVIVN